MSRRLIIPGIIASLLLGACSTNDPYARTHSFGARYEQYRPSVVELARLRTGNVFDYEISDVDIVNYADHVKSVLRSKFTNARFARYASATGQVLLAGMAGTAAAFDADTTMTAGLALSSAVLPQLGGIFRAKERAETYQDAVRLIEEAEADYLSEVGSPSAKELTANGVNLYRRTTATVHIVEKAIVGQIPTLREMKDVSGESAPTTRRPKQVIKVLSGKTAPTTTATSTTVIARRTNASIPIDTPFLDEDLPPPARRTKAQIQPGTPSLESEPAPKSAGAPATTKRGNAQIKAGTESLDDTGEIKKRGNTQIKAGTGSLDDTAEAKKRGNAQIKAGTGSLDDTAEAKKRGNAQIKAGTELLDNAAETKKRLDAQIKEGTESLDSKVPTQPSR